MREINTRRENKLAMKKTSWLILLSIVVLLAACGGGSDNSESNTNDDEQRRLFEWDRGSDFILFRIDVIDETLPEAIIANTIPQCTIYGDGRLVFTNPIEGTNEILEARLTDTQIRSFVEQVIGRGFYSWEDDIISNSDLNRIESISLNLYGQTRTIERYGDWPVDGYETLLSACRNLSDQRALVWPLNGGWLRAYPIDSYDRQDQYFEWPSRIPFSLADVARSGSPQWVSDPTIAFYLWNIILTSQPVPVVIRDEAFLISFQVPGISRTSPPVPADPSNRLPTLAPLQPTPVDTSDQDEN